MASSTVPLDERSMYASSGADREARIAFFFTVKDGSMGGLGPIVDAK